VTWSWIRLCWISLRGLKAGFLRLGVGIDLPLVGYGSDWLFVAQFARQLVRRHIGVKGHIFKVNLRFCGGFDDVDGVKSDLRIIRVINVGRGFGG
jgi:hypothetical protein